VALISKTLTGSDSDYDGLGNHNHIGCMRRVQGGNIPRNVFVKSGPLKLAQNISAGPHVFQSDELADLGGNDAVPDAQEFLMAAMGACTNTTVGLRRLLADAFTLYLKTKNFHWHVTGRHFRDYHLLLDEQAEQIFAKTDDIAERARSAFEKNNPLDAVRRLSLEIGMR